MGTRLLEGMFSSTEFEFQSVPIAVCILFLGTTVGHSMDSSLCPYTLYILEVLVLLEHYTGVKIMQGTFG